MRNLAASTAILATLVAASSLSSAEGFFIDEVKFDKGKFSKVYEGEVKGNDEHIVAIHTERDCRRLKVTILEGKEYLKTEVNGDGAMRLPNYVKCLPYPGFFAARIKHKDKYIEDKDRVTKFKFKLELR